MRETRTTNHNKKTIFLKSFDKALKNQNKTLSTKTTIQKVVSNSDFCFIENWTKK